MKSHSRYTVINALVVTVAIASATVLFLAQIRSQALLDARHDQETRIKTFWALLHEKGHDFRVSGGKLWVGNYQLSDNNELPDRIRDIFGGTATIFLRDRRVATNVRKADGARATGTRLIGPAHDAIFRDGRGYRGEVLILGVPYFSAYDPIKDSGGSVIGALYVGEKTSEFLALYDGIKGKAITGGSRTSEALTAPGSSWRRSRSSRPMPRAVPRARPGSVRWVC